jgi:formylglycine-generating enzyme
MSARPQSGVQILAVLLLCAACGSTAADPSGPGLGGAAGFDGGGSAGAAGAAGASPGTGGAGGAADCAARCDAAGCPACRGPAMVATKNSGGFFYRIDSTEVTNAQYAEFLAAAVDPASQPVECSWNTTFQPDGSAPGCAALYDPGQRGAYPVVCVSWCDARAYCEWAGKRLCMTASGDPPNGSISHEWYDACRYPNYQSYPYGNKYDPTACNGKDLGIGELVPAGSLPSCEGGLPGLYDMSGNAREWAGNCYGDERLSPQGADAQCRTQGGGSRDEKVDCLGFVGESLRSTTQDDLGFRCCARSVY